MSFNWFKLPDKNKKEKIRIEPVKAIATQLDATYVRGIDNINRIFPIPKNLDNNNSNAIIGNIDGYDYCFWEYFHIGSHFENYNSYYISKAIIKLKEKYIPPLLLLTKKSAIIKIIKVPFFILLFLIFILVFIFISTNTINSFLKSTIMSFFLICISFFNAKDLLKKWVETLKNYNNQKIYNFSNQKFKEKYVILSKGDPQQIRNLFDEKVCSRIINYKANLYIEINNTSITSYFKTNEKLTYNLCQNHLNIILKQAKLFEKN